MSGRIEQDKTIYTTEEGTFVFPYLTKPRDYQGNEVFNYDTAFNLAGEAAASLMKLIDEQMKTAQVLLKQKNRRPPYEPATDKDGAEIPGVTKFRFKLPASIETVKGKWVRKPRLFDGQGNPITDPTFTFGTGSKGKIRFSVYKGLGGGGSGVRLEPLAVMVTERVEQGGYSEEDVSFGEEDATGSFKYESEFAGPVGSSVSQSSEL
jgi:hypothetical protein